MTDNYDRIAVVRPDIFQLGGEGVFQHFGSGKDGKKNLIVIPEGDLRRLGSQRGYHVGIEAALDHWNGNVVFNEHENGISVGRINDNLDVALVREVSGDSGDNYSVPDLVDKVNLRFKPEENEIPFVMTTVAHDAILYKARGLKVEKPKFLVVEADIVNEGLISGTNDLLGALRSSNRVLSLDQAVDLLGQDLRLNQAIKFIGSQGIEYARVEGNVKWDKGHNSIRDVDNLTLRLLHDREQSKTVSVGGHQRKDILGITPKDMEQYMALEYGLFNEDIELFFLCGSQGSGKTLLSYAAAIDQVLWYDKNERKMRGHVDPERKNGRYDQIILLKPNELLGGKNRDIGALPGSMYDKLRPHLAPYIDAHRETTLSGQLPFEDLLKHPKFGNELFSMARGVHEVNSGSFKAHLPGNREVVEMTYSGFMRGRSFRNTLLLVDEAQNFEPYEMKTILERLGNGCKVIVMGDPWQVDGKNVSRDINGLTSGIAQYLDTPFTSLLTLSRHYRSQVSNHARTWTAY